MALEDMRTFNIIGGKTTCPGCHRHKVSQLTGLYINPGGHDRAEGLAPGTRIKTPAAVIPAAVIVPEQRRGNSFLVQPSGIQPLAGWTGGGDQEIPLARMGVGGHLKKRTGRVAPGITTSPF